MVSLGLDGANVRTANYGAGGMSPLPSPGARIEGRTLTHLHGKPFYGKRQIQRYLPLAEAIKRITVKPDLTGAALNGEQVDAIEQHWQKGTIG